MRQRHVLLAFASWFVPVLTASCSCRHETAEAILDTPLTLLSSDKLCKDFDRAYRTLGECFSTRRCTPREKMRDTVWLIRTCDGGVSDINAHVWEELKRRQSFGQIASDLLGAANSAPSQPDPTTAATDPQNTGDSQADPQTTSKHYPTPKKSVTKSSNAKPTTETTISSADPTSTSDAPTSTDTPTSTDALASTDFTSTDTPTPTAASQTSASSSPTSTPTNTSTNTPSGPMMGAASIAATTVFAAFAAACIGFLLFVCIRRARRHRQAKKEDAMDEALLGAGKKDGAGGVGGRRNTTASGRSAESMYANNQSRASVISIPLADRQSNYTHGLYPLGGTTYQPAPQYDPRDAYAPEHSLEQNHSTFYNRPEPAARLNQALFVGYRSASNTYLTPINTNVTAARSVSPPNPQRGALRSVRSGSLGASSALNNLPAALTPGGSMTPVTPTEPPSRVSTISTTHGPTRSLSVVSEVEGSYPAKKVST